MEPTEIREEVKEELEKEEKKAKVDQLLGSNHSSSGCVCDVVQL